MYPEIFLRDNADRRIRKGHLWIYSNEVDVTRVPFKALVDSPFVRVYNNKNKFLGVASLNGNSLLCGRIISRDEKCIVNKSFFKHRLNQALSLRQMSFSEPYYRLVHGDGDFLPGIVIDRFGDYFVVQTTLAALESVTGELLDAVEEVFRPKGIFLNNTHSGREIENLENVEELRGDFPDELSLIENQTQFVVPARTGQKTGWFYDHRQNRQMLKGLVKGASVLDVFSYVGGWGIQAAAAGAESVACVDASEQALDFVHKNAELNGVEDTLTSYQGKAVDVLKHLVEEKQKYDVIILDPPAFIKRKKDEKAGHSAYYHVNTLALRLLNTNGVLVSASCSMHLRNEALVDIVRGASAHIDRRSQLFYNGGQAADHPVHPAIPETNYLKAQFYRVLPSK